MKKNYNIYYLEDKEEHYKTISQNLKTYLNITILPTPENRTADLEKFQAYADMPNATHRNVVRLLLLEYKLDLIILDQQIGDENNVGSRVYSDIIIDKPGFEELNVISYSGAKYNRQPIRTRTAKYYQFPKGDIATSAITLCEDIRKILKMPNDSILEKLAKKLKQTRQNTNKKWLWKR
ncbi:hypothetical protein ACFFGT_10450 [Mucilaginibacter angelicae]|uniref:Uncharacterized protein n=1 Tax=Mucilaginibacter angelicae TaxID=869718 RepID=A0ABV6L559_9SPHI